MKIRVITVNAGWLLLCPVLCLVLIAVPASANESDGSPGFRQDEERALFEISAHRPLSRSLLAGYGEVLTIDGRTALIRTTQALAERLAGEGMEIRRVMPPLRSGEPPPVPTRQFRAGTVEPEILRIIERVDSAEVYTILGDLSGENSIIIGGSPFTITTRNSYRTAEISKATQFCYEYLDGLGLSAGYDDYTWAGNNWRNVVAEQPGILTPENIYVICAHLDDMPTGSIAPGADDNASGSVAVLLAASILSDYYFENTIRYVLFTGEEQGLIGSYYYVQDCVNAGNTILGALNFDMIAYDGNQDGDMEVYCGPMNASQALGDLLIDTITTYGISLDPTRYTTAPSWSDQASFWDAGYPAIAGIEDFTDFNPQYHSTSDTRGNCNTVFLTEFVKAAAGTVARLAVPVTASNTIQSGDYDGDGTADPAVYRPSSGLWALRGVTRVYFGYSSDVPVPSDYNGDGTADPGIFRGSAGLWAIRGVTRSYFGSSTDRPVPGDYDGDGCCDVTVFRESTGLWAVRGVSRVYFGASGDEPVSGDYSGNGTTDIALFRPSSGLWAVKNSTRIYFGSSGDLPVPGDYKGDGTWVPSVYRTSSGLWATRDVSRIYFGTSSDQPVPADYNGDTTADYGIFRDTYGLWAIREISRAYYGTAGDIPVTR